MHEKGFPPRPTWEVPFHEAGRSGVVRAYYGVTRRGPESGFPSLKGFSAQTAGAGFPTLKCEVDCARPGYWNILGWIQWVTQQFGDGRPSVALVDRLPSMLDRDVPFLSAGYAPTFFDAPAYTSRPEVDWRASLFLCTMPMMSRTELVTPLVGFQWGYRIARANGPVDPRPCTLSTAEDWSEVRENLRSRHPEWRFRARFRPAGLAPKVKGAGKRSGT